MRRRQDGAIVNGLAADADFAGRAGQIGDLHLRQLRSDPRLERLYGACFLGSRLDALNGHPDFGQLGPDLLGPLRRAFNLAQAFLGFSQTRCRFPLPVELLACAEPLLPVIEPGAKLLPFRPRLFEGVARLFERGCKFAIFLARRQHRLRAC